MNSLLVASFVVSSLGVVACVLFLGRYLHIYLGASWKWWAFGLLAFLLFQGVLCFPWTIALPQTDGFRGWPVSPTNQWIWIVIFCVSAGVFEETGRWVGYRFFFKPEERVWKNALMSGAGHGGLEALVEALLQGSGAVFDLLHCMWWIPRCCAFRPNRRPLRLSSTPVSEAGNPSSDSGSASAPSWCTRALA